MLHNVFDDPLFQLQICTRCQMPACNLFRQLALVRHGQTQVLDTLKSRSSCGTLQAWLFCLCVRLDNMIQPMKQ